MHAAEMLVADSNVCWCFCHGIWDCLSVQTRQNLAMIEKGMNPKEICEQASSL